MPDEKKKFRNLSTYATIMILCVVILIICAAMADGRERQFESRLNQQAETNTNIQNEIVALKDQNYNLTREKESLTYQLQGMETSLSFYTAMTQAWALYAQGNLAEAQAKLAAVTQGQLNEEQAAQAAALQTALTQAEEGQTDSENQAD